MGEGPHRQDGSAGNVTLSAIKMPAPSMATSEQHNWSTVLKQPPQQ